MKVLFVLNNFYTKGNGLVASARRTAKKLSEAGIEIKILSAPNPDENGDQPDFKLKDFNLPIFDPIVKKQGYSFSNTDKTIITEAVKWADLVHIEEPFALQMVTCKIANELGKPLTATYHLHPENLFASVGLAKSHFFNDSTMKVWKTYVFDKCEIVQCPTQNVKDRLTKWKFKSELRVISNGLVLEDLMQQRDDIEPTPLSNAKYNVITIGRYSNEKDLKTLLKAMKYSKYRNDIQLVFAGRGPKEKQLKKYASKLMKKKIIKYEPIFGFFKLDELQGISAAADLYIHCAYIEVEGLSCMEAIQTGLVPIIAKGKYTATSQFALSEKSIFKEKDPRDLANKIDYWFSHDAERKEEAKKYIGIGQKYNIDNSIKELIKMFNDAINNFKPRNN